MNTKKRLKQIEETKKVFVVTRKNTIETHDYEALVWENAETTCTPGGIGPKHFIKKITVDGEDVWQVRAWCSGNSYRCSDFSTENEAEEHLFEIAEARLEHLDDVVYFLTKADAEEFLRESQS